MAYLTSPCRISDSIKSSVKQALVVNPGLLVFRIIIKVFITDSKNNAKVIDH